MKHLFGNVTPIFIDMLSLNYMIYLLLNIALILIFKKSPNLTFSDQFIDYGNSWIANASTTSRFSLGMPITQRFSTDLAAPKIRPNTKTHLKPRT